LPENAIVRKYEPGDERNIVEFLNSVLKWPAFEIDTPKLDFRKWKYIDVPGGPATIGLVANENGIIVCHSAGLPLRIIIGGKEFKSIEGTDVCRDQEYSTEEMLLKAIECKNDQAMEKGIEVGFSYPAEGMYDTLTNHFGYRDLGIEVSWPLYILDPRVFFALSKAGFPKAIAYRTVTLGNRRLAAKAKRDGSGLVVKETSRFGPGISKLFRESAKGFDIIVVRDQELLNWRYADKRAGKFSILVADSDRETYGYVVLKAEGKGETRCCYIVDMLVHPDKSEAARLLLLRALDHSKRMGAMALHCRLVKGHPYRTAFREVGFVRMPRRPQDAETRLLLLNTFGLAEIQDVISKDRIRVHMMLGDTDGV